MKRLPRTYFGNPVLREKAKPVALSKINKPAFQKLIKRMFFTMKKIGGVGLAAPQIGLPIQLAVIQMKKTPMRPNLSARPPIVVINPKILDYSKKQLSGWEGCLSLPTVRGLVSRSEKVKVAYYDGRGKKQVKNIDNFFEARIFQHEIDHLNGTLYVDRMVDMKTLATLGEYKKRYMKPGRKR
jgi:peptide deformylase